MLSGVDKDLLLAFDETGTPVILEFALGNLITGAVAFAFISEAGSCAASFELHIQSINSPNKVLAGRITNMDMQNT